METFRVRLEYPSGNVATVFVAAQDSGEAATLAQAWVQEHHPVVAQSGVPLWGALSLPFAGDSTVE